MKLIADETGAQAELIKERVLLKIQTHCREMAGVLMFADIRVIPTMMQRNNCEQDVFILGVNVSCELLDGTQIVDACTKNWACAVDPRLKDTHGAEIYEQAWHDEVMQVYIALSGEVVDLVLPKLLMAATLFESRTQAVDNWATAAITGIGTHGSEYQFAAKFGVVKLEETWHVRNKHKL